jgi:hypothetical protein
MAVLRPGRHLEVDVSSAVVAGRDEIGVSARDQAPDELDGLDDVAGRPWFGERGPTPDGLVRGGERALVGRGPLPPRSSRLARLRHDGVVDVGDVADEQHLEPPALQPAAQEVEGDRGAQMTQVRRTVDGRPAHVDRHERGGQRP